MNEVTTGVLKINSDLPLSEILKFVLTIKKNCHTLIQITAIIPEEVGMDYLAGKLEGIGFTVTDTGSSEGDSLIFEGYVQSVQLCHEGNEYLAEIEAISATELLDREKKSRSFQDIHMTYQELVRTVLADTPDADVIFRMENREIDTPIYQYQETDWEFLKRIGSHCQTSLLPAGISLKPQLYFGLPKGDLREGERIQQKKIFFDQSYYTYDKGRYHKQQFICHEIVTYENWNVGDRVAIAGRELKLIAKQCELKNGLLVYQYTAAFAETFGTARYEHSGMAGVSLAATILETRQEEVRIAFDIDGEKTLSNVFWYPWMPVTGNLMYAIPEIGERIWITFDDGEGNARSSGCIRLNGTGNAEMDPTKRYFTTTRNKRFYSFPSCLGFEDLMQKIPLKVEIDDILGIDMESSREITILAKQGVWLSGNHISITAPQEISIVRRGVEPTVINMCNGFDTIGKYAAANMQDSGTLSFPIMDSSDSDTFDLAETEEAIMASTPSVAGRTTRERQITGTKVNMVMNK